MERNQHILGNTYFTRGILPIPTFVSMPNNPCAAPVGYFQTRNASILSPNYLQTQNVPVVPTDNLQTHNFPVHPAEYLQSPNAFVQPTGYLPSQNVTIPTSFFPSQNVSVPTGYLLKNVTQLPGYAPVQNVHKGEEEIPNPIPVQLGSTDSQLDSQESKIYSSIDTTSYKRNGVLIDCLEHQNNQESAITTGEKHTPQQYNEPNRTDSFTTGEKHTPQQYNEPNETDSSIQTHSKCISETEKVFISSNEIPEQFAIPSANQPGNISDVLDASNQSRNEMDIDTPNIENNSSLPDSYPAPDQRNESCANKPRFLDVISTETLNNNQNSKHDVKAMETEDVDTHDIYRPLFVCSLAKTNQLGTEFHNENFFKGCKWAPDGTCLLTSSNDNYLRTFDLPYQLHCKTVWRRSAQRPKLNYTLKIKEGGIIYDFVWYPNTNSSAGFTPFFLSSSMNSPIHLWDSVNGHIEATYRPYNQVDEVTHAYSLAFSPDGSKIFSGFMSELKVFSTDRPGRDCVSRNLKPWLNKSIVSAIAVNPLNPDICALGTYSKMIGLFSEEDGQPMCFLKGHQGGITHLEFASNGLLLYSGARMDSEILCWDLRHPGCVLYSFPRKVSTNQRVYFDLTSCSNYLLSGNTDGAVSIWNVSASPYLPSSPYEESVEEPIHQFPAHQDCTNGVNIHPYYPILATTSGQRHIGVDDVDNKQPIENNLKLWWIGK